MIDFLLGQNLAGDRAGSQGGGALEHEGKIQRTLMQAAAVPGP